MSKIFTVYSLEKMVGMWLDCPTQLFLVREVVFFKVFRFVVNMLFIVVPSPTPHIYFYV